MDSPAPNPDAQSATDAPPAPLSIVSWFVRSAFALLWLLGIIYLSFIPLVLLLVPFYLAAIFSVAAAKAFVNAAIGRAFASTPGQRARLTEAAITSEVLIIGLTPVLALSQDGGTAPYLLLAAMGVAFVLRLAHGAAVWRVAERSFQATVATVAGAWIVDALMLWMLLA